MITELRVHDSRIKHKRVLRQPATTPDSLFYLYALYNRLQMRLTVYARGCYNVYQLLY